MIMIKPKVYFGVDPGATTGFAIYWTCNKTLITNQYDSHSEAILLANKLVREYSNFIGLANIKFRIEDARLAEKNAYFKEKNNHSKDQGVGGVKALSKDWEAFCKRLNVPYEMVPPNTKLTKVNPEYFEKLTGRKTLKTHSHMRDAAMLVWGL